MCLHFHSVKEPSKNHDIWVRVLFSSLLGRVRSVRVPAHFSLSGSVRFLSKPVFCFGSFLLDSGCFPSLKIFHLNKSRLVRGSQADGCLLPKVSAAYVELSVLCCWQDEARSSGRAFINVADIAADALDNIPLSTPAQGSECEPVRRSESPRKGQCGTVPHASCLTSLHLIYRTLPYLID